MFWFRKETRGFTLIELLVVIAIIGILSAIVMVALDDARSGGRDANRKAQTQEILKALELYYSDGSVYPQDGTPGDNTDGDTLTQINNSFVGRYIKRLPDESDRYYYCASADGRSMVLAVDTEKDRGGNGSNYCSVTRGPGGGADGYGCTAWVTNNAGTSCSDRF